MTGSYLPCLLGVLLASLSCTAGDYEVTPCDPTVANLSQDICNTLNINRPDCNSLYQCDRLTKSCQLGPRDYDRDGDPDVTCTGSGGTDCNDFDASVNGPNKLCDCDAKKIGQACSNGIGACRNDATYMCVRGVLYCTEARPPMPNADYSENANVATGSYDLNCDGTIDMNCVDSKGATRGSCPQKNCDNSTSGSAFQNAKTQMDLDNACIAYCGSFKSTGLGDNISTCAQEKIYLCDVSCGKPEYYCTCVVKDNGALAVKTCIQSGSVVTHKVLCK